MNPWDGSSRSGGEGWILLLESGLAVGIQPIQRIRTSQTPISVGALEGVADPYGGDENRWNSQEECRTPESQDGTTSGAEHQRSTANANERQSEQEKEKSIGNLAISSACCESPIEEEEERNCID